MVERSHPGMLEMVVGSMFAGKTEELIRRLNRAGYAGRAVCVIKPDIDNRWGHDAAICSHNGQTMSAIPIPIEHPSGILEAVPPDIDIVAIEEAQFFSPELVGVVRELLDRGHDVLTAGLPSDFRNEPFGSMPVLLSMADGITRLTAICTHEEGGCICGRDATRTQRIINGEPANYDDPVILVGASEMYSARCHRHHDVPGRPRIY